MQAQHRVDFFGPIEWFLGTYYDWYREDDHVSVHLSQEAHSRQLLSSHNMVNATPANTPYQSGHTIDDIPKTTIDNLKQDTITTEYQSLVGSLLRVTHVTHPDICVTVSLLAQYNNKQSPGQYDVTHDVLKYLIGTSDHGIRVTHKLNTTVVNFIGFVPAPDTTFSNASWGPQNASVPSPSQPTSIIGTSYTRSLHGHVI
jgi:hypothetical protein